MNGGINITNWILIREYPTTIKGLTIRGYKCKYCDRPVLASIPDENKWDTNILTYIYCPHCGKMVNENRTNLSHRKSFHLIRKSDNSVRKSYHSSENRTIGPKIL